MTFFLNIAIGRRYDFWYFGKYNNLFPFVISTPWVQFMVYKGDIIETMSNMVDAVNEVKNVKS